MKEIRVSEFVVRFVNFFHVVAMATNYNTPPDSSRRTSTPSIPVSEPVTYGMLLAPSARGQPSDALDDDIIPLLFNTSEEEVDRKMEEAILSTE